MLAVWNALTVDCVDKSYNVMSSFVSKGVLQEMTLISVVAVGVYGQF
jgi:hypothetical protein